MGSCRPALFRNRQFDRAVIVTCVRWYLRFMLSLRDVEELMAERNLTVDHTTVWRWVQAYAPEIRKRLQGQLKYKGATWFMDETHVRVAGRWMYLCRAVDNCGDTVDFYLSETRDRDAAKRFLQTAMANPDNRPPRAFSVDGNRSYQAAIRELRRDGEFVRKCRYRRGRYRNNRIESDHGHVKRRWRALQGARTLATARRVIDGIEATQMIRKGQVLWIPQHNRRGQAWVFGALLDLQ
jgi:transposase, IS6 family